MTPEIAEELGKFYLKIANKKRNKDRGNNGDDDDIKNMLDNDLITPEYLKELSKRFFKLTNALKREDNKDDSESSENNSGNNSENNSGNNSGNNTGNNSGNNIYYDKKLVDESKNFLEKTKKYDKDKKYTSVNEVLKRFDASAEDDRKTNEILKKYYAEEAQKVPKGVEKFNKMINDSLDMSSGKSEIINRLIELYHLNKIDNNIKANENIDNISINREIHELEKKILTFLAQLHAGNNSKKLKNDINGLLASQNK